MIENVVIFGNKLYKEDSYINFGFYNAFCEFDYNIEWIDEDNLEIIEKMQTNTIFIINTTKNIEKIPVHISNYYIIIKGDSKRFRTMDRNKLFLIEYDSTKVTSKYTKIDNYVYQYKRKRTLMMPYGSMLTPNQIIENLADFVNFENREDKIVMTRDYDNRILDEVIKTKAKNIIIKKLISLDDEIDLIRKIKLSCCFASNKNKIDFKTLTHITYGTYCITNSEVTHQLLNEQTCYLSDASTFSSTHIDYLDSIKKNELFDLIELIINNHTFLHRVKTILKYFNI